MHFPSDKAQAITVCWRLRGAGHAETQAGSAGRWPAPHHPECAPRGSPHPTWRGVGVWCGQVGASQPPQRFRAVVIFCPRACGVFHIARGKRWGFAVDNPARAIHCKGFQRWSEIVHVACGVGVRVAGQRPALPARGFSTWDVESGGCLLWTSGSEADAASLSGRGQLMTIDCTPGCDPSQIGSATRTMLRYPLSMEKTACAKAIPASPLSVPASSAPP